MRVTTTLAIAPGDANNLRRICDPRKSSKHEVYGQLHICLNGDSMQWFTCRDARHMAILTFPMDLELPGAVEFAIHSGSEFLKAIELHGENGIELDLRDDTSYLSIVGSDDPHQPTGWVTSLVQARHSFRALRARVHDQWDKAGDSNWTALGFQTEDASLFSQMRTAAGKATTVTLECQGAVAAASFKIEGSAVTGMTCINIHKTEWSPDNG